MQERADSRVDYWGFALATTIAGGLLFIFWLLPPGHLLVFDVYNPGLSGLIIFGLVCGAFHLGRGCSEALRHGQGTVRLNAKAFFILSIIIAALMAGLVVADGIVTWRVMQGGAIATATIVDTYEEVVEADDGRRSGIVTMAEYEFYVGDKKFAGTTEGYRGEFTTGQTLIIHFNPDDPLEHRPADDRERLGHFVMLVMIAGCIGCGMVTIAKDDYRKWRASHRSHNEIST